MKTKSTTRSARRRSAGFTLVEVLLVVAILGILASIVVVNFSGKDVKTGIAATRTSIKAVSTAIDLYEVDNGTFPQSLQALVTSSGEPNWNGPYIRGGLPSDAWGTPLGYTRTSDKTYEIRSAGPDRQMGSADDLTNERDFGGGAAGTGGSSGP